jgi:hypothetical protein
MRDPVVREFLLAFWKIHVLYHAEDGSDADGPRRTQRSTATRRAGP